MVRTSVQSSNILAIGHDGDTSELEIEFKSGVYRYLGVPVDEYERFITSKSLGRHFVTYIKPNFECRRVVMLAALVAGEPCEGAAS